MSEVLERFSLAWLMTLLRGIFGREVSPPAPSRPDEVIAEPSAQPAALAAPPKVHRVRRTASRSKTQTQPDAETLASLLDGLDESFASLQIPSIKGNWLPRSDVRALHKLGIYIPTPWLLELTDRPALPPGDALPAMASCLMMGRKYDTEEKVCPRFAFAIKAPRLPENVEQFAGTAYRFGYCVQLSELEHDKNSPPRLFWVWAWVVVAADGSLVIPREKRLMLHAITHRRAREYKTRGSRASHFQTRQWVMPTAFQAEKNQDQQSHERFLLCVFRQLLMWWNRRADNWSVGVRSEGKRVTFTIAKEHTAAYFADREKTAAVDGTAKKIIHFVREHQRANGQIVKAHVRGLRTFMWRSFACHVTAPNLNGIIGTTCPITPEEVDADDDRPGLLTTEAFAETVAANEDFVDLKTQRELAAR